MHATDQFVVMNLSDTKPVGHNHYLQGDQS